MKFSVLIDNYNQGRFLRQAVDSALAENPLEVVVVDDGSTDDSLAILQDYGTRIRVVTKSNGGQSSAFNAGFVECRGEVVCLLDADDWFYPGKLASIRKVFEQYPELGWCAHALEQVDSASGRVLRLDPGGQQEGVRDVRGAICGGRLPIVLPATSGLCYRRELLTRMLPMPLLSHADDYLKFVSCGLEPGYYLEKPLGALRLHDANAWTNRTDNLLHKAANFRKTALGIYERWPHLHIWACRYYAGGLSLGWYAGLKFGSPEWRLELGRFDNVHRVCIFLQSVGMLFWKWVKFRLLKQSHGV